MSVSYDTGFMDSISNWFSNTFGGGGGGADLAGPPVELAGNYAGPPVDLAGGNYGPPSDLAGGGGYSDVYGPPVDLAWKEIYGPPSDLAGQNIWNTQEMFGPPSSLAGTSLYSKLGSAVDAVEDFAKKNPAIARAALTAGGGILQAYYAMKNRDKEIEAAEKLVDRKEGYQKDAELRQAKRLANAAVKKESWGAKGTGLLDAAMQQKQGAK